MASTKTVSSFQQEYTSIGYGPVEKELKQLLNLLKTLDSINSKLRPGTKTSASEEAVASARKAAKTVQAQIGDQKRLIETKREMDRVQGDIANGQMIYSKQIEAAAAKEAAYQNQKHKWMLQAENDAKKASDADYNNLKKQLQSQQTLADKQDRETRRAAEREARAMNRLTGAEQQGLFDKMSPEQRIQYQLNKWKQVFRRVTDALLSFYILRGVTAVVGGFFRSIIESNAALENLDARMRVMTGSSGGMAELRRTIIDLTVKTPFIIKDFAEASVSLTAFGINAKNNLKPVADWAAAIGRDLPDVALAFSKIATGSPRTALLLSTRGISKGEFDEEVKRVGNRVDALNNIIRRKFGDMSFEVSKTFQGVVSNIKDSWFILSAEIGKPLFANLKRDVETIYALLNFKGIIPYVRLLGEGLGAVYQIIKILLLPTLALLITSGLFKLKSVIQGVAGQLNSLRSGLAATAGAATLWGTALITIVSIVVEVAQKFKVLADSQENLSKTMRSSGMQSTDTLNAMKRHLEALEELDSFWPRFMVMLSNTFDKKKAIEWLEQLEAEKRKFKDLIAVTETLIDMRNKLFASKAGEVLAKDIYDLQESMKGVEGGPELLSKFADELEKVGKIDWFQGGAGAANVADTVDMIRKAGTMSRDQLSQLAQAQVAKKLKDVAQAASRAAERGSQAVQDIVADLLASLIPLQKLAQGGELQDFTAEMNEARARFNELMYQSDALYVKEASSIAKIIGLVDERKRIETTNAAGVEKTNKLNRNTLDITNAIIKAAEARNARLAKEAELRDRIAELSRDNAAIEVELAGKTLERQFALTGNLNLLYEDRNKQLQDAVANVSAVSDKIAAKKTEIFLMAGYRTMIQQLQAQAELASLDKERLQLWTKIQDVLIAIDNLQARNLTEGIVKGVRQLRVELSSFYDDLAQTILGGTREILGSSIKALLFGGGEDKTSSEIAKLRMDLQATIEEGNRAYKSASAISRREDETNQAYLERVQFSSQLNAQAIDQYTFKTKELELMEQINNLERERNSIILERLASFGDKIIDQITNQLAGGLISMAGGLFNRYSPTVLDVPATVPLPPPPPFNPKGVSINITGNQIFGESDFNQMVDGAMQRINARRSF